jgi:hypothetical protein
VLGHSPQATSNGELTLDGVDSRSSNDETAKAGIDAHMGFDADHGTLMHHNNSLALVDTVRASCLFRMTTTRITLMRSR